MFASFSPFKSGDPHGTNVGFSRICLRFTLLSATMSVRVRCPYCVEGSQFKLMVGHVDGRFICARCGHISHLNDPSFVCSCLKCENLKRPLVGHLRSQHLGENRKLSVQRLRV